MEYNLIDSSKSQLWTILGLPLSYIFLRSMAMDEFTYLQLRVVTVRRSIHFLLTKVEISIYRGIIVYRIYRID